MTNRGLESRSDAPLILLADDEPHITTVLARKLEVNGFRVATAEDGEEALDLASEACPALVITDLQMPFMSGIEFARKLKTTPTTAQTPVIMLTARGYVLDPAEIAETNIRFIMSKPFSAREIVDQVQELLREEGSGLRKSA